MFKFFKANVYIHELSIVLKCGKRFICVCVPLCSVHAQRHTRIHIISVPTQRENYYHIPIRKTQGTNMIIIIVVSSTKRKSSVVFLFIELSARTWPKWVKNTSQLRVTKNNLALARPADFRGFPINALQFSSLPDDLFRTAAIKTAVRAFAHQQQWVERGDKAAEHTQQSRARRTWTYCMGSKFKF